MFMKWTILKLSCFCFFCPLTVCAQNHVGIILSGYEENCEVTQKGKVYECEDRRELYVGDTVKKKPSVKSLKIKWAPYVRGVERGQTYLEVVANKPDTLRGNALTNAVKQYLNDFVKTPTYGTSVTVTRDPKGRSPSFLTLYREYPLRISKAEEIRSVIVSDARGQKVLETQVKRGGEFLINPEAINMTIGEKYMLTIASDTSKRVSTIAPMDEMLQNEVTKGLMEIGRDELSPFDMMIRKAVYFQLISDAYPDKVNLYWLSNQLLEENTTLIPTQEQKEIIEHLRQRYLNQLRNTE